MNMNREYMVDLEQENYELKKERRELEATIEGYDEAYVEAINLLYDCKKMFEQMLTTGLVNHEAIQELYEMLDNCGRKESEKHEEE